MPTTDPDHDADNAPLAGTERSAASDIDVDPTDPDADVIAERTASAGRVMSDVAGAPAVPGYTDHKGDVLKRLRRIEGQVRGLQRMVDADTYCIDVLTQISAATRALQAVAVALLEDHMRHCVAQAAVGTGQVPDDKVREAAAAIGRLVRS